MNTPFRLFLVFTVLLASALPLQAQLLPLESDNKRVQFAWGGRAGINLTPVNIEPAGSGSRSTFSYFYEQEVEMRLSPKWSLLFLGGQSYLETYRVAEPVAPAVLGEDVNIVDHPYSSNLNTFNLRLGGQRNVLIGKGELNFALTAGFGLNQYIRTYDFVASHTIGRRTTAPGIVIDRSNLTVDLTYSGRMQYMRWLGRQFGLGVGVQVIGHEYLGGGVESPEGLRFDLDERGSAALPVRYNVNYDITSLTVDPTVQRVTTHLFLSLLSRF